MNQARSIVWEFVSRISSYTISLDSLPLALSPHSLSLHFAYRFLVFFSKCLAMMSPLNFISFKLPCVIGIFLLIFAINRLFYWRTCEIYKILTENYLLFGIFNDSVFCLHKCTIQINKNTLVLRRAKMKDHRFSLEFVCLFWYFHVRSPVSLAIYTAVWASARIMWRINDVCGVDFLHLSFQCCWCCYSIGGNCEKNAGMCDKLTQVNVLTHKF